VSRDAWIGVGGKMGTMSFAGVAATVGIATLVGARHRVVVAPNFQWPERFIIVILCVAAVLITHWLSFNREWGVVLGSAVPSAAVAGVLIALEGTIGVSTIGYAAAWLGASFVGMTSPTRLMRRWMLPAIAVVFGVLLLLFSSNLTGLGGDLGATAAASVLSVFGLVFAIDRVRHSREQPALAH
jgi:hypothetical protein